MAAWDELALPMIEPAALAVEPLRGPETGLVMLRGRMDGAGAAFNLGEATMTRCTLRLRVGEDPVLVGHASVLGRALVKAELAARFDALLQDARFHGALMRGLITPLHEAEQARLLRKAAETAPTKVEFFTMVRGDE